MTLQRRLTDKRWVWIDSSIPLQCSIANNRITNYLILPLTNAAWQIKFYFQSRLSVCMCVCVCVSVCPLRAAEPWSFSFGRPMQISLHLGGYRLTSSAHLGQARIWRSSGEGQLKVTRTESVYVGGLPLTESQSCLFWSFCDCCYDQRSTDYSGCYFDR